MIDPRFIIQGTELLVTLVKILSWFCLWGSLEYQMYNRPGTIKIILLNTFNFKNNLTACTYKGFSLSVYLICLNAVKSESIHNCILSNSCISP